ncbi:hypothetical protein HYH03_017042 [Edaphochlamys debaryana]|uniref:TRP C-terminal domain-containing protein n=1 Tax=Edaphochlamys debaryana TaxID=47281 RepID=A0A835XKZ0_9CHLO|nr:hypothetical protein HYH03_017042 [Edaphochlamys debaryana]|eukprot:KAG2484161.1 hypothetical protein HYH03_017042 [Edaphochlamys debaryana]
MGQVQGLIKVAASVDFLVRLTDSQGQPVSSAPSTSGAFTVRLSIASAPPVLRDTGGSSALSVQGYGLAPWSLPVSPEDGGSTMVPLPGYWHSDPRSPLMHACPNEDACTEAPEALLSAWLQRANASGLSLKLSGLGAEDERTWALAAAHSAALSALALESGRSRRVLQATDNNASLNDPGGPSNTSYLELLCAEGYAGNLCATCQPGLYLDSDFQCNECPTLARTIGLGILAFAGTAAVILYAAAANLGAEYKDPAMPEAESGTDGGTAADPTGNPPAADIFKVLVVHVQYFIIIARLNFPKPGAMQGFTSVLAAATGAENYLAYSHACLLPNQDSAGQAFLQVLGALLTPCAVTAVCLLLWLLRYGFFRATKPATPQLSRSKRTKAARTANISRLATVVSEESGEQLSAISALEPAAASGWLQLGNSGVSSVSTRLSQYLRVEALSTPFAHLSTGLSYMDESLTLGQQLGMVFMVAIFVLFPSWASAGFSVFSCMEVDAPEQLHASSQQQYTAVEFAAVTHPRGYWTRNMQQECYTGMHAALYVPVGVVFLIVFCLSPPLVNFFLLWSHRADLMKDSHTQRVYGFMYLRYKEQYFWWDSVLMAQTLALVAVDVFGSSLDVSYQALMLMLVLFLIAGVNSTVRPSRCRLLHNLEFWSSIVLCATIALNLYLVTGTEDLANQPAGNVIAALTLSINVIFIASVIALIVCAWPTWPRVRAALKRVRAYLPGGAGQAGSALEGEDSVELPLTERDSTEASNPITESESQRFLSQYSSRRRRPTTASGTENTPAASAAASMTAADIAGTIAAPAAVEPDFPPLQQATSGGPKLSTEPASDQLDLPSAVLAVPAPPQPDSPGQPAVQGPAGAAAGGSTGNSIARGLIITGPSSGAGAGAVVAVAVKGSGASDEGLFEPQGQQERDERQGMPHWPRQQRASGPAVDRAEVILELHE